MRRLDVEPDRHAVASHPAWVTEDLILATLKVWQSYYDVRLTRDVAIDIILATGRLFGALSRGTGF
jgi:hypothetical protein